MSKSLKVGDVVFLRDDLVEGNQYGALVYYRSMYRQIPLTILDVNETGDLFRVKWSSFIYSFDMIDTEKSKISPPASSGLTEGDTVDGSPNHSLLTDLGKSLEPTMSLRWKTKYVKLRTTTDHIEHTRTKVLQQRFMCKSTGKEEWRDVPLSKE